jgi:hypothetical protein
MGEGGSGQRITWAVRPAAIPEQWDRSGPECLGFRSTDAQPAAGRTKHRA